ncbi:endo-beta-N-acetylglucosaminidase H [Chryseobacterium kwangjuense]|uniref:endo-beta-N-acetylglucosaminidase H n=1 Tax=Chryseobacterium kwangjuense TaxID=267125 RepID=UPI000AE1E037|nr:endo-beta-N-acetylglucosaminidase H [Chryseobacterium kwangjuense]
MKKAITLLIVMIMHAIPVLNAQQLSPTGICYVEVNNNNLLNAGSYKLQTSGKYLFNVVNIFAANINYDTGRSRPYLYCNNNVTKVLTNADTYIKPLQDKGIKVVLTILGNHQGAGLCNFPTREAARDFAQQLAHTVNTYGLDGIDFDDEYSDYGQNGTGQPNASSFVMLVQELKALLPNKLITFYYYGPAASRLSWNGLRVGDYVNYSWNANYGTFSAPNVPPLTKAQISPAAVWMGNTSNSTTTSLATQTKNGAYGVFMWYDLHGTNETSQLSAGTQTLYGEQTVLSTPLQSWTQGTNCDAPIGLFTSNLTGTNAKLNWSAVGTNTYDVDYKLATATTWTNAVTATTATSVTISGLTANTEYDWRIRTNCSVKSTYIFAPRFNSGSGTTNPSGSTALSLDGSTESGSAGNINLSGSALSFEGWIKPSSFKSGSPFISSLFGTEVSDTNTALLRLGDANIANNKLQFVLSINNVQQKLTAATALNANTWYHVAATYDGSTMKIYINGVLDASKSQTGSVNSNGAFYVGYSYATSRNFNGKVDEVRVWKKALSQTEISQNMCNVTVPATSLAAYWKFNEGSGSSVQDSSGNGVTLTLTGVEASNWGTDVPCTGTQKASSAAKIQNAEGLEEISAKKQIKLSPNPLSVSSPLTISVPEEYNKGKLTVYNFNGRPLDTKTLNAGKNQYDFSKLTMGNYIIRFESQNGSLTQTEKLMIK